MAADAGARGPLPGRPRRCPEPHRGGRGGNADLPPFSLSAGAEGVRTQRGAGPPTSASAGGGTARRALPADGERRLSSPRPSGAGGRAGRPSRRLTHSSVPQLMAELEATRAVWLPRCPSVGFAVSLSDLPLADRRARGYAAALPPKVPPEPGSPVSEQESTGEAAAASPPPGTGREGAAAEGRRDPERGGGGTRCTLGSGRTRALPAAAGRVFSKESRPPARLSAGCLLAPSLGSRTVALPPLGSLSKMERERRKRRPPPFSALSPLR